MISQSRYPSSSFQEQPAQKRPVNLKRCIKQKHTIYISSTTSFAASLGFRGDANTIRLFLNPNASRCSRIFVIVVRDDAGNLSRSDFNAMTSRLLFVMSKKRIALRDSSKSWTQAMIPSLVRSKLENCRSTEGLPTSTTAHLPPARRVLREYHKCRKLNWLLR